MFDNNLFTKAPISEKSVFFCVNLNKEVEKRVLLFFTSLILPMWYWLILIVPPSFENFLIIQKIMKLLL